MHCIIILRLWYALLYFYFMHYIILRPKTQSKRMLDVEFRVKIMYSKAYGNSINWDS